MAFETTIVCDQDDCNTRRAVNGPGDMPDGWIFIQLVKPNIALLGNGNQTPKKQVMKIFCGWRCLSKEVKKNLTEKIDV